MDNSFKEYYSTVTQERGLFYPPEAAALFTTLREVPSSRLADADPIDDSDSKKSNKVTVELDSTDTTKTVAEPKNTKTGDTDAK